MQEVLTNINKEDKTVPDAVEKVIPQITKLTAAIADKMLAGGRLFYMGAGTSGRLVSTRRFRVPTYLRRRAPCRASW